VRSSAAIAPLLDAFSRKAAVLERVAIPLRRPGRHSAVQPAPAVRHGRRLAPSGSGSRAPHRLLRCMGNLLCKGLFLHFRPIPHPPEAPPLPGPRCWRLTRPHRMSACHSDVDAPALRSTTLDYAALRCTTRRMLDPSCSPSASAPSDLFSGCRWVASEAQQRRHPRTEALDCGMPESSPDVLFSADFLRTSGLRHFSTEL
jgi:hypothetical protein